MKISLAESESQVRACHPVISELRPHVSVGELVRQTLEAGNSLGYRLAFVEDEDQVVAVAGFRIGRSLAWGKFLYVDDLVVREKARGKRHGSGLFDWLVSFGRQQTCEQLHLDSGVQRFRTHKFYLDHGLEISSHHFRMNL